ncbi:MAG: phosphate acyltransferase PlsX [Pseudomonadota bacterium]
MASRRAQSAEKADMSSKITVSVDAMGNDRGIATIIDGCARALKYHPELSFILHGDGPAIKAELRSHSELEAVTTVEHADVAVSMEDKPSQALRKGRYKSSMWKAVQSVKDGDAHFAVSAGNTGALMAMSKFCLRMMEGVDRPVIACIWPTLRGESVVLDVGANVGANGEQLATMGVLGAAMARALLPVRKPTVGLLNIGEEEVKGQDNVQEGARLMRAWDLPNLQYHGFVEGDDIGKGTTDVVVTEGFAGNIALKTAEGTARQIGQTLSEAMRSSFMSKIGAVFARGAFSHLRQKLDPRRSNGGVFLGLNGIVIKSHGGTDGTGFAHAIEIGADMAANDLNGRIQRNVARIAGMLDEDASTDEAVQ